jgi:cell division protein FtsQ
MDRRVRERRRLVSRERGSRRAGLIFLGVLVVGALAAFLWLRSSDVFAVQSVSVPVTHHVSQQQLAEAVSAARGVSLLKVSTGAIEKTLETLPYVRSIHVYRKFPNGLEIRLQEYDAVARMRNSDGRAWLLADDGRVLERAGSQEGVAALPLIVTAAQASVKAGETAPQSVMAALPVVLLLQSSQVGAKLPAAEQVSVSTGGEVVVRLQGGTELRLGPPTDLKQKMIVAADIIQKYLRDGKTLEYVDASAADRVAVKAQ